MDCYETFVSYPKYDDRENSIKIFDCWKEIQGNLHKIEGYYEKGRRSIDDVSQSIKNIHSSVEDLEEVLEKLSPNWLNVEAVKASEETCLRHFASKLEPPQSALFDSWAMEQWVKYGGSEITFST